LGVAVAATALLIGGTDGADTPPLIDPSKIELVSYGDCDTALSELKQAALENVSEIGGGVQYGGAVPDVATGADGDAAGAAERNAAPQEDGAAAPMAEAPADAKAAEAPEAPEHSGTNTHEEGVDEPDLVKTDGRRLVTIADGTLRVVDVASRTQTGTLELPGGYATQLLMDGDRALVLSGNGYAVDMPTPMPREMKPGSPPYDGPTQFPSQLVLVDLSGEPTVLGTLAVDGNYLDARQVGSVARVVVRSMPRLEYTYPDGVRSPELAELENRAIVAESTLGDWLPRYQLTQGGATSTGQLPDCASVSHPVEYTGTAMLTVLTLDLQRELGTGDPVTIVADGDTVYGTGTNLYVADDHIAHDGGADPAVPVEQRTEIYQFDISKPGKPVHVASGGVAGTLLNQYSLSEHDGHLRVATTMQGEQSQSMVSVLERQDNVLAQVGQVAGLGLGERIYSVRFIGDTGYVVTFRETDPLYTVDLSDPASPAVTGELKITGYSAYLHPAGDGRLIGVGQEASTQGQTTGTQVSLFDIANRAAATRVAQYHLQNSYSEAETDPHAFLYWPDAGLVVLPVNGYEITTDGMPMGGALVLRLEGDSFTEVARISHQMTYEGAPGPVDIAPRRTLVIGADLWTVSEAGVKVNALEGMAELAWVPFS
jgi:hypothetical protein